LLLLAAENSEKAFNVTRVKKQGFAFAYVFFLPQPSNVFMFFALASDSGARICVFFNYTDKQTKKVFLYRDLQPTTTHRYSRMFCSCSQIVM
jgi:hypothetical protein